MEIKSGIAFGQRVSPKRITISASPHEAALVRLVRETPYGEVKVRIKDGVLVMFTIVKDELPNASSGMDIAENIVD